MIRDPSEYDRMFQPLPQPPQQLRRYRQAGADIINTIRREQATNQQNSSTKEVLLFLKPVACASTISHFKALPCTYSCEVEVNSRIEKAALNISHNISTQNQLKVGNDWIWEIGEFYGGTQIIIKIYRNVFLSKKCIGTRIVDLGSLHQAGSSLQRNQIHPFLFVKEKIAAIPIVVSIPVNCGRTSVNGKSDQINIQFDYNFIYLKNCTVLRDISTDIGDVSINSQRSQINLISVQPMLRLSDLHLIAAYGSAFALRQLLFVLARQQILRQALSLQDSHSRRPLDVALLRGNFETVRVLLRRAGNLCFINTQANQGCAIHMAIAGGEPRCLWILLRFLKRFNTIVTRNGWVAEFSLMVEWKDDAGNTPLLLACSQRISHERRALTTTTAQSLTAIASNDVIVDVVPMNQSKCSKSAGNNKVRANESENTLKLVRILLHFGANISSVNQAMQSALIFSCQRGDLSLLKELLTYRSVRNTAESRNSVLRYKAQPWLKDVEGNNCLFHAVMTKECNDIVQEKIILCLLKLGQSILELNQAGESIFHLLGRFGLIKVCDSFIEKERNEWNDYQQYVKEKSILITMLSRPRLLTSMNVQGRRPIDVAIENKHFEIASKYLEAAKSIYGADSYSRYTSDKRLIDVAIRSRDHDGNAQCESPGESDCADKENKISPIKQEVIENTYTDHLHSNFSLTPQNESDLSNSNNSTSNREFTPVENDQITSEKTESSPVFTRILSYFIETKQQSNRQSGQNKSYPTDLSFFPATSPDEVENESTEDEKTVNSSEKLAYDFALLPSDDRNKLYLGCNSQDDQIQTSESNILPTRLDIDWKSIREEVNMSTVKSSSKAPVPQDVPLFTRFPLLSAPFSDEDLLRASNAITSSNTNHSLTVDNNELDYQLQRRQSDATGSSENVIVAMTVAPISLCDE